MASVRRWTLRGLLALAGMAVLLVIALYTLLDTRRGTHWLLAQALPLVSPQAHFASVTGTLSRGIIVTGLELPLEAADVQVGLIEGKWNLLELLGGQFTLQRLSISDVNVIAHPSEPSEPGLWPSLALPFPVSLVDGEVSNLSITLGEDTYLINHIVVQASGGSLHTRIDRLAATLAIEGGEQQLSLSGKIGNNVPYPFDLTVDWGVTFPDPGMESLAGHGTVSGTLAAIRLDHNLLQPSPVSTQADIRMAIDPERATIDLDSLQLAVDSQWSKLRIPLPLKPAMESDGTFHIGGDWNDYRFELQSRLTALPEEEADIASEPETEPAAESGAALEDILAATLAEPGRIVVRGSGQQLQVELAQLLVETAAGNIEASGHLDGGQPLGWDLHLAVAELRAGLFAPAWPAVISATVQTRGHWQADAYEASLTIESLSGQIFDETITGTGDITLSNHRQVIDNLLLRLGDNQLSIHGEIADAMALDWKLEAPDLAQLYPDIGGMAASTGSLRGTLAQPQVTAHLHGRDLRYTDARIGTLDFDLGSDDQGHFDLDLNAQDINAAPLQDGKVTLNGQGSLERHQLTVTLTDKDNTLSLSLAGGLDGDAWAGKLTALAVDNPLVGPWQLVDAANLRVAADAIDLAALCLAQEHSQLCTALRLEDGNIALQGNIDELQLTRFTNALPEGASINGAINSRFALQGPMDKPQGTLSVSIDPLQLSYQALGEEEVMEYTARFAAKAALDKTGLNADLDFIVDEVGTITARIDSPGQAGTNPLQRPMAGTVRGRFDNLAWLDGLFPQLDKLKGALGIDLAVSGTPAAPQVTGNVQLDQLAVDIPVAGIKLQQGHLTLALENAGTWRLNGGLTSGAGRLTLDGDGLLDAAAAPSGQLTIVGQRFTLVDLPDTLVLVSPDININLEPEAISIRGDIDIPEGRFILKSLPEQAVEVSADEHIYSAEEQGDGTHQPLQRPLNTRVQITLDDSFRFEGFGLATRLGGNLRLSQRNGAPPQATGTLSLLDGVYEAYGQKLTVQRGLLIFQGPLDNPGLNITAVRKTPEATVGIEIGGVAQDIRSEIFSTPSLPPTDAMAILITGKAPSDMTESDANQVVNAAAALGISQSEWVTNRLQSTFGLDVLNLQGGDEYLDSSLVVGKYLTPELFVSYVQNLFTPAGSVQLEYSLTRYLGLKASSGETQSVDLLYKIEH